MNQTHIMYFYKEENTPMVEVHVDDLYIYDNNQNKGLPVLGLYGGNISLRLPAVKNQHSHLARMNQ